MHNIVFAPQALSLDKELNEEIQAILGSCEIANVWNDDASEWDRTRVEVVMHEGKLTPQMIDQLRNFLTIDNFDTIKVGNCCHYTISARFYGFAKNHKKKR